MVLHLLKKVLLVSMYHNHRVDFILSFFSTLQFLHSAMTSSNTRIVLCKHKTELSLHSSGQEMSTLQYCDYAKHTKIPYHFAGVGILQYGHLNVLLSQNDSAISKQLFLYFNLWPFSADNVQKRRRQNEVHVLNPNITKDNVAS